MKLPSLPLEAFVRRPLLRRLLRPAGAFASAVTAGIAGFSALGDVGVVNASFWLLDPSSIELYFQAHDGPVKLIKIYAIVVLSGLVVASLWIGETLFSAAFGGQIQQELKFMQMERKIDQLDGHVVICGYGTFGKTIATRLDRAGRKVVVVETKTSHYERAIDDGMLVVNGDARREDALSEAGVNRADTVVGAIDDSNVNIQIAIVAGQLAPDVKLVVRAGDEMYESLAQQAGADEVIIPEVVSGEQVTAQL